MRRGWRRPGLGLPAAGLAVVASVAVFFLLPSGGRGGLPSPEAPPGAVAARPPGSPAEVATVLLAAPPSPVPEGRTSPAPVPGVGKGTLIVHLIARAGGKGDPASGVQVVVANRPAFSSGPVLPPQRTWKGRSDADGTVAFPDLDAGYYGVTASASESGAMGRLTEVVASEETLLELPLEWESTKFAVVGRVVASEDGRPIPKATVRVGQSESDQVLTDDSGAFRLESVGKGWTLNATSRGFVPASLPLEGEPDQEETFRVEIRLEPGGSIRGVVRDEANRPAAGVRVRADEAGSREPWKAYFPMNEDAAMTGEDGAFAIESLVLDGLYSLSVWAEEGLDAPETEVFVSKDAPDIRRDIVVRPLARLRVRWAGDGAEGRRGAGARPSGGEDGPPEALRPPTTATLRSLDGSGYERTCDGNEFAEFQGTPAGRYEVSVLGEEGIGRTEIVLRDRERREVSLALAPGPTIEGLVVTSRGEPPREECSLSASLVTSADGEETPRWSSIRSGRNGAFRFIGVAAGREYEIRADRQAKGVVVKAPSRDLRIVLPPTGSVCGRVLPPEGEALPDEVSVEVESWNERGGPGFSRSEGVERDGRFRFLGLPAGSLRIHARGRGFLPVSREVPLPPDAELDVGDLALRWGASLEGRVLDSRGKPVLGARVRASEVSGGEESPGDSAITGKDGRFTLVGLAGGRVDLGIEADGFVPGTRSAILPGRDPVEVVLDPTVLLAGRARSADGVPLVRACVVAATDGAEETWQGASVDFRGRFELRLAPGKYHIMIREAGLGAAFFPAEGEDPPPPPPLLAEAFVTIEVGKDATLDLRASR